MREPAAWELNRHMQKFGVQIDRKQQDNLKAAAKLAPEGTFLQAQLNVSISLITPPTATKTGTDLFNFRPDVPAPPPKKEKEKEKEKEAP